MDSSFGARLKAQRERQDVTLETIADRTKIRVGLLDALERDDVSQWPAGIYRRSYLRSYAAAIGLDPEATVREFLALYPEAIDDPEATLEAIAESERATRRPPTRLQYLIDSAMGAVPKAFLHKERKASAPAIETAGKDITPDAAEVAVPMARADTDAHVARDSADEERHVGSDEEFELASAGADMRTPLDIDLPAMGQLCTRIAEAKSAADLERLLEEGSRILHAVGIIVWPWDQARGVLWPSLSHGYSRQMLAKLPTLSRDAENPIGAALRSSVPQVVDGGGAATSAIVLPLMTPRGCAGVLAVECASGVEQEPAILALATILAAQLSLLVNVEPLARSAIA